MATNFFADQPKTLIPKIIRQSDPPAMSAIQAYPGYIMGNFGTPDGNQPAAYNNMVYVWAGGPAIPAGAPLIGQGVVTSTVPTGTFLASPTSDPFYSSDMTIGYSVGQASSSGGYPNVVATAFLEGGVGSGNVTYFGSSLGFVDQGISPTAIQFTYTLPPGTNPLANTAFVGLWNGTLPTTPYGSTPNYTAAITNNKQASGTVPMIGLKLAVGSQYTAALFASGFPLQAGAAAPTNIVAWMSFSLEAPSS